jgi:hypothetical protein
MLITERTSDGRTIVRLHKDWHPGRISVAYVPPMQRIEMGRSAYRLQTALLKPTRRS